MPDGEISRPLFAKIGNAIEEKEGWLQVEGSGADCTWLVTFPQNPDEYDMASDMGWSMGGPLDPFGSFQLQPFPSFQLD